MANPTLPPIVITVAGYGPMVVKLDDSVPRTTSNFIEHVEAGTYNGTLFHRVIPGFMAQGGQYRSPALMDPPVDAEPIPNESHMTKLGNTKYSLSMARTTEAHSAVAQFFINFVDNPFLNFQSKTNGGWGYCRFGEVVEGREIVDRLNTRGLRTSSVGLHQDVPRIPVLIESIEVVKIPEGSVVSFKDIYDQELAAFRKNQTA